LGVPKRRLEEATLQAQMSSDEEVLLDRHVHGDVVGLEGPGHSELGAHPRRRPGDILAKAETVPVSGMVNPLRTSNIVDFPAPLGPIRPVVLGGADLEEMSERACSPPKAFETFLASEHRAALDLFREVILENRQRFGPGVPQVLSDRPHRGRCAA